ncbi:hypothetical protein ACJX0J_007773, partial [Zea mays]
MTHYYFTCCPPFYCFLQIYLDFAGMNVAYFLEICHILANIRRLAHMKIFQWNLNIAEDKNNGNLNR